MIPFIKCVKSTRVVSFFFYFFFMNITFVKKKCCEQREKKVLQIRVSRYSLFRPNTKGFLCQARIMRNAKQVF